MPISHYKELIKRLGNQEYLNEPRWFIFLLMNPNNQTNAGVDIIKNLPYMDERTGNVTFFLPGFSNAEGRVVPYSAEREGEIIYKDDTFGELYFDRRGFLDTVAWLESGGAHSRYRDMFWLRSDNDHVYANGTSYRYSEDLDLVIIRYRPKDDPQFFRSEMFFQGFDLQNMVTYNLDSLKREGINILRMIMECVQVVSSSESEREVKLRLENFIFSSIGSTGRHMHLSINVFIAGSKALKAERDAVSAALMQITNKSSRGYVFRAKTYEDFDRSLTEEGRQAEYDRYIANEAEYAIFILDGAVGGITFNEFNVAMEAYKRKHTPEIYVYSRIQNSTNGEPTTQSDEAEKIKKYVSDARQYYIEYKDIDDLRHLIKEDFRRYSI